MRNELYEKALKSHGVEFHYKERVSLEDIDIQGGLRNQCRLENPLDEDLISLYAKNMKSGDDFPAVVLWKHARRTKLIPMDGNQRLAARLRNKDKFTDAYIIECNDRQKVDVITWTLNNKVNGKRLTNKESLQHAIALVQMYGVDANLAAKECGISKYAVYRAINISRVREILLKNNIAANSLTDEMLHSLTTLQKIGEDIVCRVAEKIIDKKLNSSESIEEIIRKVKSLNSHEERIKFLNSAASQNGLLSHGFNGQSKDKLCVHPSIKLGNLLRKMQLFLEKNIDVQLLRSPVKLHFLDSRESAYYVVNKLTEVFGLGALVQTGRRPKKKLSKAPSTN